MVKLVIHTIGIFVETGLGVWIFSNMFHKRDKLGKRQFLAGWTCYTLIVFITFLNFAVKIPIFYQIVIYLVPVCSYIIYRLLLKKYKCLKKGISFVNCAIIIVIFAGSIGLLSFNTWLGYISTTSILAGGLFIPFILFLCFKCSFIQTYLWQFFYLSTIGLLKLAFLACIGGVQKKAIWEVTVTKQLDIGSVAVYELIIYGGVYLLVKYLPVRYLVSLALKKHKMVIGVIAFGEWYLISRFAQLGDEGFNIELVTATLVFAVCVVIAFLIVLSISVVKETDIEKSLLEVRNEAIERQYQELRSAYEHNRCLLHDEKHMIYYLKECLVNGNIEKAKDFLGKYGDNVVGQMRYTWTGIPTLDFMINVKKRKMDDVFVEFELDVELDSLPMEDTDFVVLLGNLFDNAIESVEKCSINNRIISLSLKRINDMFMLQMENTSTMVPQKKRERFITTKQEKKKHGWGIESIRYIVSKYSGDVIFDYDNTMFYVVITINME